MASWTSTRASIAANERWGRCTDRTAATAKARQAADDRFLKQADPEGVLSPAEREKCAENLRRAHYARMAIKSAESRRAKGRGGRAGGQR